MCFEGGIAVGLSLAFSPNLTERRFRWNVPVPLGMPHRLMEDDVYREFYIPAGSSVLVNIQYVVSFIFSPSHSHMLCHIVRFSKTAINQMNSTLSDTPKILTFPIRGQLYSVLDVGEPCYLSSPSPSPYLLYTSLLSLKLN
jgi:hypothetical protein